MELLRLAGHPLGGLADIRLDHRRFERAAAPGHHAGHLVAVLAGRGDDRRHAAQLRLRQLVLGDRLAEHLALVGIGAGLVIGRLHHAHGPGRSLQPPVLEAGHLQVEALPDPVVAADEVLRGHEPVIESDLEAVHAPVAQRGDGPPLDSSAPLVGELEVVAFRLGLRHDEQAEAPVGFAPVGIGAGQQHQHVGPAGEGAPRLGARDQPAALGGRCRHHQVGHVAAVVGLGDGDSHHGLAGGDLGEPVLLLLLGAAALQRPGEDLGPGDERAARTQRCPGQLLGGDDHAQVVALGARGEPAVLLGHRQAEATQLGQPADDVFGNVGVAPVDVLGGGSDLVLAEAAEGVRHELEVVVEMAGCVEAGQRGDIGWVAVGGDEVASAVEGAGRETPLGLSGEQPGVELAEDVGDETAGEPSFGVAQRTPRDQRVADAQRRGGVG